MFHLDLRSCGGRLSQKEGTIASTNFPNSYGTNEDCVWIIQPQHTVIFSFDVLDLPGEIPCLLDYVEVCNLTPITNLSCKYFGQLYFFPFSSFTSQCHHIHHIHLYHYDYYQHCRITTTVFFVVLVVFLATFITIVSVYLFEIV